MREELVFFSTHILKFTAPDEEAAISGFCVTWNGLVASIVSKLRNFAKMGRFDGHFPKNIDCTA
jgi:hypothetical protein